jgi:ubiquinone/menaquinone biosynthesis C-methylase UbiE
MVDAKPSWFANLRARLREPLVRCAQGELPPSVALMHLCMHAVDEREIQAAKDAMREWLRTSAAEAGPAARIRAVLTLFSENPRALAITKSVLAHADHDRATTTAESDAAHVAHWAEVFDRAFGVSPEGSVALYSLGNPMLLRAATEDVVARMKEWGLLGRPRALLDLGCGIGRFEEVLAPEVGLAVGIDVSREMIARARDRCASLPNVHFLLTSGRDLSCFADRTFDVLLAADVFPYFARSGGGLVERHMAEAARVLRPGGDCLIVNFSYDGSAEADRREFGRLAHTHGFVPRLSGSREFRLWDGLAFLMSRAS